MKWHLRLAPALCAFILLTAVSSNAGDKKKDPPAAIPNYYPMQVGNQWTFRVTVGENVVTAVSRIAKLEKIDDVEMARLEAVINGNVVATEHIRNTDKGVLRHRNNGQEISPPLVLLKYPLTLSKDVKVMKWDGELNVMKEKGKYTCDAREEAVEVPAGKFKAIRVSIKLDQTVGGKTQTVNTSYWFVQDIGFVKQTVEAPQLNILMELEKFEKGKEEKKQ